MSGTYTKLFTELRRRGYKFRIISPADRESGQQNSMEDASQRIDALWAKQAEQVLVSLRDNLVKQTNTTVTRLNLLLEDCG